ncbi:hypothetical protein D4R52_00260 [bacterium]|nr:MAG: hypothetical protein D4R52_00260 [bacterium]
MFDVFDPSEKWRYYLTRPFDLFGASLWHRWYYSPEIKTILGVQIRKVLFVEESRDMIRQYRTQRELLKFAANIMLKHLLFHPNKTKKLLEHGIALNQQASRVISKGPIGFEQLEEAVSFYTKLAIYSTILPYFIYELVGRINFCFKAIKNLSEQLRTKSYYPQLLSEIIIPLAEAKIKQAGIQNAESAVKVITYEELLADDYSEISSRLAAKRQGKYFIYQNINGIWTINWTSSPQAIINIIEGRFAAVSANEISGKIAFRGCVTGHVKIVLSATDWPAFNNGDILVAVSTNPALLPLIHKAGAIITNEGGITSHAAIISRELKKPCIIGTKIATKVFKNGDLVEVNANRGIVRKLRLP